jgi:glycosyltransferase involved in cell wall biosynthesis
MVRDRAGRVLILDENASVPFDRRVWHQARTLAGAGHEVHVVCPRGEGIDLEPFVELEGVSIHRFPSRFADGGVGGYAREYAVALWHMLRISLRLQRRRPFDVVHATNPPDILFLIALPLKLWGTRFVFDHHDLVPELFQSRFPKGGKNLLYRASMILERLTLSTADMVIATNESYKRVAVERGRKDPAKVHVVRNGPDLSRFVQVAPDPALKRGKPHLACYLGVMGFQDGVDYAVRALAHLHRSLGRTDLHTTFIGAGDAFEACVALAHELRLDDMVEFTGRISDAEVHRYLSTADVCLAPDPSSPLNDVSTMSKIMEYMAMGRPIVSFDLAETRVSAGDAALYARPNDESEFAQLIDELLNDPERREHMGKMGRKRVEDSLSWDVSARELLRAYERLLSAGRNGSG